MFNALQAQLDGSAVVFVWDDSHQILEFDEPHGPGNTDHDPTDFKSS